MTNGFGPLLAAVAALPYVTATITTSQAAYEWKNVAISGANCWVTGIAVQPTSKLVYMRTDVGGAYRWDAAGARWIPLTDRFTFPESRYYSVESLALDPRRPDAVYIACGAYTDKGNGSVFASADRGTTWKKLNLDLPMGGNQDGRWGGERLGVDPKDSNVLLFGSRTKGLWRSADGGKSWNVVAAIPVAADNFGVGAVAFDPETPGLVYAAVSGSGVWASRDHGVTWNPLPGAAPSRVLRLSIGSDHALWVTHRAGVSKWANNGWESFQVGDKPDACCGLAIDPTDPRDVIVSDRGSVYHSSGAGHFYRTRDGGAHWSLIPTRTRSTVPWFSQLPDIINVSTFAFDPANPHRVWAGDWSGILRTDDIDASMPVFTNYEAGHEEGCANALITPPHGPELVSAFLDLDGFVHDHGLDAYPSRRLGMAKGTWIGHTTSLAYSDSDPAIMARTGAQSATGNKPGLAVSPNSGATWTSVSTFPTTDDAGNRLIPQRAAIAADDPKNMVVMCGANASRTQSGWNPVPVTQAWWHTQDSGATWTPCKGLPNTAAARNWGVYGTDQPLVSDGLWGNAFVVFDHTDGKVYRSADGGATFEWVNTSADQLLPTDKSFQMKAEPGSPGVVWASFDRDQNYYHMTKRSPEEGLYRSIDAGAHWTRITGVSTAFNFCFGKSAPRSSVPALYLYGRLTNDTTDTIYRSLDLGKTWTNITDPANPVGDLPACMEASRQTFGRVFIGTGGRGVFYGDPSPAK